MEIIFEVKYFGKIYTYNMYLNDTIDRKTIIILYIVVSDEGKINRMSSHATEVEVPYSQIHK